MSRTLPWIMVTVCFVAFVASFSELQRVKTRLGEVSRHEFHDHADVRQFIISAALAETDQPIIVIGDSITEMAPLPREICGRPVVNAGIGGMRIREAVPMLQRVLDGRKPFLIALAIGANDIGSNTAGGDFSVLLKGAAGLSPRLVSIAVTSDSETNRQIRAAAASAEVPYVDPRIAPASKMKDGIHYTAAAYANWIPALKNAVESRCGHV